MNLIGEYFRDNSLDFEDEDSLRIAENDGVLFFIFKHQFSSNHGGTMLFAHGKAEIQEEEGSLQLLLLEEELYKLSDGDYPKKYVKCTYIKYPKLKLLEKLKIELLANQDINLITDTSSNFMDTRGDFRKTERLINWQIFNFDLNSSLLTWENRYKQYK